MDTKNLINELNTFATEHISAAVVVGIITLCMIFYIGIILLKKFDSK